jgi:putative membrane protein
MGGSIMMGNDMMYGYHLGIGWMLFGLVFLMFIVACSVLLVLWFVGKSGKWVHVHKEESALEMLNKRYAMGEISKEQYEEVKKDIAGK